MTTSPESEATLSQAREAAHAAEERAKRAEARVTAEEKRRSASEGALAAIRLGLGVAEGLEKSELEKFRETLTSAARPRTFARKMIGALRSFGGPVGVLIALLTYVANSFKEADDRFRTAYVKLGDSYNDIVKSCADNPDLDCYDMPHAKLDQLYGASRLPTCRDDHDLRQQIIYTRLLNHFEQAYTLLDSRYDPLSVIRRRLHLLPVHNAEDVWPGWRVYIASYLERPQFRKVWVSVAVEWSGVFRRFMDCLCRTAVAHGTQTASVDDYRHCDEVPGDAACPLPDSDTLSPPTCVAGSRE